MFPRVGEKRRIDDIGIEDEEAIGSLCRYGRQAVTFEFLPRYHLRRACLCRRNMCSWYLAGCHRHQCCFSLVVRVLRLVYHQLIVAPCRAADQLTEPPYGCRTISSLFSLPSAPPTIVFASAASSWILPFVHYGFIGCNLWLVLSKGLFSTNSWYWRDQLMVVTWRRTQQGRGRALT